MSENCPICLLEAASFSGKTTLAKSLQNYGIRTVQEYARYANAAKKFPPLPFKTMDEAKESTPFFINLESDRCKKAIRLFEKTGKPVLMDRGLLSCLAFQFSVEKLHPEQNSAYQHSLELVYNAYQRKDIFEPTSIIYLEPPSKDDFIERVNKRGPTNNDQLNVHESGQCMKKWYLSCIKECFTDKNSLVLPSSHGNPESNIHPALEFLYSSESYKETFLSNFNNLKKL